MSAHGTNPASAQLAGLKVMTVKNTQDGKIDSNDLNRILEKHGENVSCIMITYPSTYGLFDTDIKDIIGLVHSYGA